MTICEKFNILSLVTVPCQLDPIEYTINGNVPIRFTRLTQECDGSLWVEFIRLNDKKKTRCVTGVEYKRGQSNWISAIYKAVPMRAKKAVKEEYPDFFK